MKQEMTILTYYSNKVPEEVEIFALCHGAEHRVNDIIQEWGDIDNWTVDRGDGIVVAKNDNLGAMIVLMVKEVNFSGATS